jgi:hypothetical protein
MSLAAVAPAASSGAKWYASVTLSRRTAGHLVSTSKQHQNDTHLYPRCVLTMRFRTLLSASPAGRNEWNSHFLNGQRDFLLRGACEFPQTFFAQSRRFGLSVARRPHLSVFGCQRKPAREHGRGRKQRLPISCRAARWCARARSAPRFCAGNAEKNFVLRFFALRPDAHENAALDLRRKGFLTPPLTQGKLKYVCVPFDLS